MNLPQRQLASGIGRVGKVSRLMICMQPGAGRSLTQVLGIRSGTPASAVRCELRDAGMPWPAWTPSRLGKPCEIAG